MFDYPFLLIAGIVAIGALFVVSPVALDAYGKFRLRKVITCPGGHGMAEVTLNAGPAALAAGVGTSMAHVRSCSLWPKHQGCDEKCVAENWPEA